MCCDHGCLIYLLLSALSKQLQEQDEHNIYAKVNTDGDGEQAAENHPDVLNNQECDKVCCKCSLKVYNPISPSFKLF